MMNKGLNIILILALLWQVTFGLPCKANVEKVNCQTLSTELKFPIYLWKDNSVDTKAIIVGFHGMTFYGSAFNDVASYLASEGYPVYSFDFRGFGSWRTDKEHYPNDGKIHFGETIDDGKALLAKIHEQNPEQKIICIGESLGSNLILSIMSSPPQPIDGAILCGLGVKEYLHPRPRWIIAIIKGFMDPDKPINLEPYIKPYLASDKSVTKTYLSDPQICHNLSPRELIKAMITNRRSLKASTAIPSDIPILMVSGQKDMIFHVSALKKYVKTLADKNVTLKILPREGHLLLELQPIKPEMAKTINSWMNDNIKFEEKVVRLPTTTATDKPE